MNKSLEIRFLLKLQEEPRRRSPAFIYPQGFCFNIPLGDNSEALMCHYINSC